MQTSALQCVQIDVTPTVTAAAYSAGNQVGGAQTLTHAALEQGRCSQLQTVSVIDIDGQGAALQIFLFSQAPTLAGSDKAAFSMTAANLKSQCIGVIPILTTDYVAASSGQKVATKQVGNGFFTSVDSGSHLYAAVVTTGTPTFTTTASLVFKYVFARHY